MLLSKVLNGYYVLPMGQSEIVGYDCNEEHLVTITWHDSEECDNHRQEFLDQEIQESWPIVRGGFVITNTDDEVCGFIAMEGAVLKPQRLAVVMQGGVITALLSEGPPAQVMVIDYDTEDYADNEGMDEQLRLIPQGDAKEPAEAMVYIEDIEVNPVFIEGAFASSNV